MSLPASEMTSDREKMDRAQYSNAPNLMATAARYGAMMIRAIRPKMVPRNEKKMPVPSALAPSPLRAMGAPSKAVTIEAGVPGMFSRIEETRPPEMPPMYSAISKAMARLSLIAKVMGRQIVTAMVAVRPGIGTEDGTDQSAHGHQNDAQRVAQDHGETFHQHNLVPSSF